MAIKYYLRQNAISANLGSHKPIIVPYKVNTLPDIVEAMAKKGTTVSKADILATFQLLLEVISEELQEGNHVNLPFVNLKPGISGEFRNSSDSFDPTRHKLKATASIGIIVKKSMQKAKAEKISMPLTVPVLTIFKDIQTQSSNTLVSAGGIGQIVGNHLKYNPENPNEGIFFVSANHQEFKVNHVAIRTPKQLLFSIPESLPVGSYSLIIKKAFGKSDTTIRNGRLAILLTSN